MLEEKSSLNGSGFRKQRCLRFSKNSFFVLLLCFFIVVLSCCLAFSAKRNKTLASEKIKLVEELGKANGKYELLNFRVGGFHSHCFGENVNLTEEMHKLDVAAGQCINMVALDYSGRVVIVSRDDIAYDSIGCTAEKIVPFLKGIGAC